MTYTAENITAIYDAGRLHWDRYAVFIDDDHEMALCLSYGLGYSEFAPAVPGDHLGRPITFEDLPEHLQRHILWRINYAELVEAAAPN